MKIRLRFANAACAVCLAAAFVAIHILAAPTQVDVVDIEDVDSGDGETIQLGSVKKSRTVGLLDNKISFDIYQMPFIGSPEADYIVIELFDYTCPHCRDLHQHIHKALKHYGDQLAVVVLPVPMETYCNPTILVNNAKHQYACTYAKYSLAVSLLNRDAFPAYHDWMMEGKRVPPLREARARAEKLIDKGQFSPALMDPKVKDWIDDGIKLYTMAKKGGIPKLIIGSKIVAIPHTTTAKLYELLETNLGIQPVGE
jgi:hypothetical protein